MKLVSIYYSDTNDDVVLVSLSSKGLTLEDRDDIYHLQNSDIHTIINERYKLIGFYNENNA